MSNIVRYNPTDVNDLMRIGQVLAQSGMFQDARQEAQAVTKVLAGAEMGFGPVASMTGIHVIKGRVSVGANLMAAAVKKSGKYDYRVRQMTPEVCEIEFFQRAGDKWESIGTSAFTLADARKAQTQNLDKFARNMLFARAMSNGVRWYCPDALGGSPVYTPEEMGADTDEEGNVIQGHVVAVERQEEAQEEAPTAERVDYCNVCGDAVDYEYAQQTIARVGTPLCRAHWLELKKDKQPT